MNAPVKQLRPLTARPTVIVDDAAATLIEPSLPLAPFVPPASFPGVPGPFGRERIVSALRTNKDRPMQVAGPVVLRDNLSVMLADPDGNLIGRPGVWIHRIVSAGKVTDTRRL